MFGLPADVLVPTNQVLDDVRCEIDALVRDLAERCSGRHDPPNDGTIAAAQAGLLETGELLSRAARSLPLPDDPLRVVLLGRTQAGKSTLFSFLTGSDDSPSSDGTQRFTRSVVALPMNGRADISIVDTPGVGAMDGLEDREKALDAARSADLVVWVATNDSQPSETASALSQVARWGVTFLLVFNCRENLAGNGAIDQFLAYPDFTFADLDGHSARLARFLDPHCQRPLNVFPIHADAALRGRARRANSRRTSSRESCRCARSCDSS